MQSNGDANPCYSDCDNGLMDSDLLEHCRLPLSPSGINPEDTSSALDIATSSSFLLAESAKEVPLQDRELICDDALVWLNSFADDSLPGCVFTSLPDISEVPDVAKGRN